MLHENIRALTCQNISQNSSADSREHTDADEKERSVITVFLKCGLYSDDGENAESERIHDEHDDLIGTVSADQTPDLRDKHSKRC